jgi:hypothetical protein
MLGRLRAALTMVFVLAFCTGFKVPTHVASANRALDALASQVDFNSENTDTLVFTVYDEDFPVDVRVKDAYRVILENQEFFRAGTIGPDAFSDLISGQTFQHGEESGMAKSLVNAATGGQINPPTFVDQIPPQPLQGRVHPSQYRSIDYAMLMLQSWHTAKALADGFGLGPIPTEKSQDQALAFILGYIGHCVGDAFAHTYVNKITGQAWNFSAGTGLINLYTEEFQHVMIEGFIDSRVPGVLENTDGSEDGQFTRYKILSPSAFLDFFFASRNSGQPEFGDPSTLDHLNSGEDWYTYFSNTDQFHGGPVYNYFNAQVSIGDAAENFGPLKEILEVTDGLPEVPQTLEDFLLALDAPPDVMNDIGDWVAGDLLEFITGRDCSLFESPEAFQILISLWNFLATFDDRIDGYTEKARVARENWIKLDECTAQNLANKEGPDFDPATPTLNRDACTILADKAANQDIWADNAPNGDGLVRGSVTDQAFLNEIIAHFRGQFTSGIAPLADAIGTEVAEDYGVPRPALQMLRALLYQSLTFQPFEPRNDHRSFVFNTIRVIEYLLGPGFLMDDFRETLIGTLPWDLFQTTCSIVRDEGKRNCINDALKAVAVAHEAAGLGRCGVEYHACRGAGLQACQVTLCRAACIASTLGLGASVCDDICNITSEAVCRATVGPLCPEFCVIPGCNLPDPYGGTFCGPVGQGLCDILDEDCCVLFDIDPLGCEAATDEICEARDPSQCGEFFTSLGCERDLVDHCTDAAVGIVDELFSQKDYVGAIFDPIEDFCDIVEDPIGEFAEFVVDNKQAVFDFVESHAPVLLGAAATLAAIPVLADAVGDASAGARVNFAFVNEDVAVDSAYRAQLIARVPIVINQISTDADGVTADDLVSIAGLQSFLLALNSNAPFVIAINPIPAGPVAAQRAAAATLAQEILKVRGVLRSGFFEGFDGPTLAQIRSDIGGDLPETFDPFFNAAHGLQLIPLNDQTDIQNILGNAGVRTDLLPWTNLDLPYSEVCRDALTSNIYCDVLISNDDPDCRNCTTDRIFDPGDNLAWHVGRGLIPFDSDEVDDSVNTFFPLSTSGDAYFEVYQNIFRTPDDTRVRGVKRLFEFEEEDGWTIDQGQGTLVTDPGVKTSGGASTEIQGCNFISLTSRRFLTTALDPYSHTLTVDVFKPQPTGAIPWFGALQLFASIPAAGINNAFLGQVELGTLANGAWSSVNFTVTEEVFQAIAGDYPGMTLSFKLNTPCGAPLSDFYHLDNLRFTGDLTARTVFHRVGSRHLQVRSNSLFGFENFNEWSVPSGTNATISPEIRRVEEGLAALRVVGASWIPVNSVTFNTTSLLGSSVGPFLSIDVFVPNPQPEWYWVGDVRVELTCNGNNQPLGAPIPLTYFFEGEYNVAIFEIPSAGLALLQGNNNCVIRPVLNITGGPDSGIFLLDNMGFLDDPGDCIGPACTCNDGVQNGGETGVDCGGPCTACAAAPTCSDGIQNQGEQGVDCGGPCVACPTACAPATYQAETMFHSTGGTATGGWNIWSDGYISTNHLFASGNATLTVNARGTIAAGVWPHMVVSVGGVEVGQASVNTTSYAPYVFNFSTTTGNKEIRVTFDNDLLAAPEDRNLIVDSVAITCPSGGGGSCTTATAVDLGAPGTDVTVPKGGCVKVQNAYPSWWGTRVMRLENTTGSYPVPFTWTNTCSNSSGSGSFTGDWQSKTLTTTSSACATLIDLTGTGTGNITLRYWAN